MVFRVEAATIVFDYQLNKCSSVPQTHADVAGTSMFLDVSQSFLENSVDRQLYVRRGTRGPFIADELDWDACPICESSAGDTQDLRQP
jgi:hypothetical protein